MTSIIKTPNSSSSIGVRGRLLLGFSATTLVLFIAICIILIKVTSVTDFADQLIKIDIPSHDKSYDLNIQLYHSENVLLRWLVTHNNDNKIEFANTWKNINSLQNTLDNYSKNWNSTDITHWQEVKSQISQLQIAQEKVINIATTADTTVINAYIESNTIMNKLLDSLDGPMKATGERRGGLFDIQYQQLEYKSNEILISMDNVRLIEYSLLIISILISLIIAAITTRTILQHIDIFRQHSSRIASGDLTQRLVIHGTDDLAQLGIDLNTMTDSLGTIAGQITETCHNMVTTLEEVKRNVDVQSAGASEQASSINQITASLEEIEKSSAQTIDKAKSLGEVAERTREKGQLGLQAVEQSILGMKEVREKVQAIAQTILDLSNQTQQVGEITAVVNTLAQQSKMLALNASIEAAKAGEAGKGFAVVAVEVKNLAEQSEQSTTQVQKILEDIRHATEKAVMATEEGTKGVDHGTSLVEQTGEIVRSLSDVIHEATMASQQIESAIRQEGIGIEQITAGMSEINQVTNAFVESVKETTEAIGNLATITNSLKEYITVYKT